MKHAVQIGLGVKMPYANILKDWSKNLKVDEGYTATQAARRSQYEGYTATQAARRSQM
jgi:hypothetical protein